MSFENQNLFQDKTFAFSHHIVLQLLMMMTVVAQTLVQEYSLAILHAMGPSSGQDIFLVSLLLWQEWKWQVVNHFEQCIYFVLRKAHLLVCAKCSNSMLTRLSNCVSFTRIIMLSLGKPVHLPTVKYQVFRMLVVDMQLI